MTPCELSFNVLVLRWISDETWHPHFGDVVSALRANGITMHSPGGSPQRWVANLLEGYFECDRWNGRYPWAIERNKELDLPGVRTALQPFIDEVWRVAREMSEP